MQNQSSSGAGGLTFTGALALVFIALKLGGTIEWSWWWVLSPIWISLLIGLVIIAAIVIVALMRGTR